MKNLKKSYMKNNKIIRVILDMEDIPMSWLKWGVLVAFIISLFAIFNK